MLTKQYVYVYLGLVAGLLTRYTAMIRALRERVANGLSSMSLPEIGVQLRNHSFRSRFAEFKPAGNEYQGMSSFLKALLRYYLARNESSNAVFRNLETADDQVDENIRFQYPLVLPQGCERARSVIFLLHGLNERSWDKYLPWACRLAQVTGSAVALFPLSFHVNRAPAAWSNPRLMHRISRERKELFPGLKSSSFANAAISARLHLVPQRLCYSGLQSMKDLMDLVGEIRTGRHSSVRPDARIDVFGYSIGGLVGELLLLAHEGTELPESRLVLFCGGATLDLSYPISPAILDSEALRSIEGYYGPDFDLRLRSDDRLSRTLALHQREAEVFLLLADSRRNAAERRFRFSKIRDKVRTICLSRDAVIPPSSVMRTVNGDAETCDSLDSELDFPYTYSHEIPFPVGAGREDEVDCAFEQTFAPACEFLA